MISVSRLRTCPSSWAITPATSSRLSTRSNPVVAATAALAGLRPVAKALGASSSTKYTLGIGSRARPASSRTMPYSSGALRSSTSVARCIFSTILSAFQ